jgi:pyruvate/2-oxoglutarate dehydrogenase complex dihydrolipoamide dehydrogenase (E3) component
VLIALGRKPSTGDLGLEPGGFVDVDAHMRVPDVPWLYAVGDINGVRCSRTWASTGRALPRTGSSVTSTPWLTAPTAARHRT